MQPIKAPKQDRDYDDRFLDCQEAIENKIQQVMEEAIRAGWTREEAAAALVEVADLVMKLASKIGRTREVRIVSKEAQSRIANGAADHLAVDD